MTAPKRWEFGWELHRLLSVPFYATDGEYRKVLRWFIDTPQYENYAQAIADLSAHQVVRDFPAIEGDAQLKVMDLIVQMEEQRELAEDDKE